MVNILSVGTPVDSTQVQEIKSIKGMPVGWAFINGSCISFAVSSRKNQAVGNSDFHVTITTAKVARKLTKATLQNLIRVMVHLPESFVEMADSSERPVPTKDGFLNHEMAQPRFTDYYDTHPQIHDRDNYITPTLTTILTTLNPRFKITIKLTLKNYETNKKNPYYPPKKSDFYSEHPPIPCLSQAKIRQKNFND